MLLFNFSGTSSQIEQLDLLKSFKQLWLSNAIEEDKSILRVRDHLQTLTVNGNARHGGKSANSSFRSIQNQTDVTISNGATKNIRWPRGFWSASNNMLIAMRLDIFQ